MTGIDTNVLVRYLTLDDPRQAAVAAREIEAVAVSGKRMLIQPLVLCELAWVLEGTYDFAKPEIQATLQRILATAQFEIAQKDIVWAALDDYGRGKAGFADCFIGRANQANGAPLTLTFDKALKGNPRFKVLPA